MELLQTPDFWIGLLKIIWINIILSGGNPVVVALAARAAKKSGAVWFWRRSGAAHCLDRGGGALP